MEIPEFTYLVPSTIAFFGVGGFLLGRIFFRAIALKTRYLWNYLIVGWVFIILLFHSGLFHLGGLEINSRWIEAGILYTLYIGFIALGNHQFRG